MSRDNDVTTVLALNRFSAFSGFYFEFLQIYLAQHHPNILIGFVSFHQILKNKISDILRTRCHTIIPLISFHKISGDLTKNFGRDDFRVAFRFVADVINPRLEQS